jgi:predicted RNA-binding protein YlqC (UPF0109 family)
VSYAALVEFCVKKLVDSPDDVQVQEVKDRNAIQVQVRVAPDDTGKVIGKNGRLITALRRVVGVASAKGDDEVYVKVITE